MAELKKAGVEVLLNHPLKDGKVGGKDFDCLLNCAGYSFSGPGEYMKDQLAETVCKKSGQIQVNSKCQVTNQNPLSGIKVADEKVFKNIFSYGDVCLTPANEDKQIVSMYQYGFQVANNLVQVACEGNKLMDIPTNDKFHRLVAIPIGSKCGLFLFNDMAAAKNDAN